MKDLSKNDVNYVENMSKDLVRSLRIITTGISIIAKNEQDLSV